MASGKVWIVTIDNESPGEGGFDRPDNQMDTKSEVIKQTYRGRGVHKQIGLIGARVKK